MCKYKENDTWLSVYDAALKLWVLFMQWRIAFFKPGRGQLVERMKATSYTAPSVAHPWRRSVSIIQTLYEIRHVYSGRMYFCLEYVFVPDKY
jgi:hypothetical protein